jgi:hypothetical protein
MMLPLSINGQSALTTGVVHIVRERVEETMEIFDSMVGWTVGTLCHTQRYAVRQSRAIIYRNLTPMASPSAIVLVL